MLEIFRKTCSHQPDHGILIVGEGNFSFARDLVNYETNTSIHATSFDSTEVVHKDNFAKDNVEAIASCCNATVQHSIDATQLSTFYQQKFSVIIFNFPHTGGKSNIKKCRKLLVDFFASAVDVLCNGGRILVSLCRGQGGTPSDASRGNYGNSWKVATGASVSGFILRDLFAFDTKLLQCYRPAGYRGVIGQNFFTVEGLVHVFEKGISFSSLNPNDDGDDVKKLEDFLGKQNEIENLYSIYFRNKNNQLFQELELLLTMSLNEKLDDININCPKLDFNLSHDLIPNSFMKYKGVLFFCGHEVENPCLGDFQYSFYSRSNGEDISPFHHPLKHHINFTINTSKSNMAPGHLRQLLLDHVKSHVFQKYETVMVDCTCSPSSSAYCHCVATETALCCRPYLKQFASETAYDADAVPNFIEDIPLSFWTGFSPEIVITDMNENNEVEYRKEDGSRYELDNLERNYFITKASDLIYPLSVCTKLIANGRCVATLSSHHGDHDNEKLTLTFHSNEIFLLAYVPDLRYLWSEDDVAREAILDHLRKDVLNKFITTRALTQTLVKHPLCFRHDLCFWLTEKETEEELLRSMRLIAGPLLHSVRLIKVLRHVETGCTSYCYRMIYGRIDGPLSHEETVKLQNRLRVFLLHKGYMLR